MPDACFKFFCSIAGIFFFFVLMSLFWVFLKKFFSFYLFIFGCTRSLFSVAVHGLSLVVKHRILIAVASFIVQHGL